MKILFIVPPFSLDERYGKLGKVGSTYPPLGLAYLAAIALERRHEVKIVDGLVLNCTLPEIESEIVEFDPDIIGMQTFFSNIDRCLKIAGMAKQVSPGAKIILGGPEASTFPERLIEQQEIDFIIKGEGEIAFAEFLKVFEHDHNWHNVKGLIWKKDNQIIENPLPPLIKNLDDIPLPAWTLLPMDKYSAAADKRGKKVLHLMTSRGCPFHCAFCATGAIFGKTYRYHSTSRVLKEIEILTSRYGSDEIHFFDDIFTINRKRVIDLCQELIKRKLKIKWICETRVDTIDRDLLLLMKKAGCYRIAFGVESGVPRLLRLINKGINLSQVEQVFKWCREIGMETLGLFMLALPSETKEESYETINFALKIKPDFVQFALTAPFPGTELYELSLKYGTIIEQSYNKYTSWEVVYIPNGRSKEDVEKVFKEAYRKFYLRPGFIITKIRQLSNYPLSSLWRLVRAGMGIIK